MFIKKPSRKIIKNYVSKIDRCLAEFDATHRPSPSQQAEIKKYQWVYQRRDQSLPLEKKKDVWNF